MKTKFSVALMSCSLLVVACSDDAPGASTSSTSQMSGTGDGDGGPTGDGDGDPTGDGDGDPTGDGDGDGEACGDGMVDGEEECDDGNPNDNDACTNACTNAVCGDGIVHDGVEMCDDGNDIDGDGCNSDCMAGSCGDGEVQDGEACDDGNDDNSDDCAGCQVASCGDGYVYADVEACDDGNDDNNDACTDVCALASCGDGFVYDDQEGCDDGNNDPMDGCDAMCGWEVDPQRFEDYSEFDSAERIESFDDEDVSTCDREDALTPAPDWVGPGWYRYTGEAGTQMATAAPGDFMCGTDAAGWLDGSHPEIDEGVVQRTVCFDYTPSDCWQTSEIEVVNCGNYYLYNLPNPLSCNYRYCGSNG